MNADSTKPSLSAYSAISEAGIPFSQEYLILHSIEAGFQIDVLIFAYLYGKGHRLSLEDIQTLIYQLLKERRIYIDQENQLQINKHFSLSQSMRFVASTPIEPGIYINRKISENGEVSECRLFVGFLNLSYPQSKGKVPMSIGPQNLFCCPEQGNLTVRSLTPEAQGGLWCKVS